MCKGGKSRAFRIWEMEHLFYDAMCEEEYHAAIAAAEKLNLEGKLDGGEYLKMVRLANESLSRYCESMPFFR